MNYSNLFTVTPTASKLIGVLYVLVLLWLSLRPSLRHIPSIPHIDKLLHCTAHFILCCWLIPLLKPGKRHLALLFSLLLGLSIELLQWFIPSRSMEFLDLIANCTGAAAAYCFMQWLKPVNQQLRD